MTISRQVGAKYISYHPRTQESNLDCTQEKRKKKPQHRIPHELIEKLSFDRECQLESNKVAMKWIYLRKCYERNGCNNVVDLRLAMNFEHVRAHIYRCQTSSPVIIVTNILQPVCLRSMQVFQQDVFVQRKTMLDIQWVKVTANSR